MKSDPQVLADAVLQINIWSSACDLQAERIMSAAEYEIEIQPQIDIQAYISRQADSQLLLISLFQVRALSALVARHCSDFQRASLTAAMEKFDVTYPQIRRLRNVVAHIDEYIEGRGRSHRNDIEPSYQGGSEIKLSQGQPTECTISVTLASGVPPVLLPVIAAVKGAEVLSKAARRAAVISS
jgi:hypothetical protein